MTQLIDRRKSGNKSTVNRRRFIQRYKKQIKGAVFDAIGKRSITEIDKGESVSIPARDISEPRFQHGQGGSVERVLPGNFEYIKGDKIQKPSNEDSSGSGSKASNQGDGDDDFVFQLSREEFLEMYFEDLELPDLVEKELSSITMFKNVRAGVSTSGIPTNINIIRSLRQATGRRKALSSTYKRRLNEALKEQELLESNNKTNSEDYKKLLDEIETLKKKVAAVPFIDSFDLRYNNKVRIPAPSTKAVMFCIMDVSGSMDEPKKDIAKRFFILLYLFLKRNYLSIELVFIRHHTSAKEVDENDFFYSRETGGTVVSSSLELLNSIIEKRYSPSQWNIYVAQASDGDNWNADSPYCMELLQKKIMPLVQYFAYIEIMPRHHQSLWEVYEKVKEAFPNFAIENIDNMVNIYPVFRDLFKRKTV
jgi:uncharacterized sporulation protein YeaH/YhbH (DUF444 family)